jgi:hypothetical protein
VLVIGSEPRWRASASACRRLVSSHRSLAVWLSVLSQLSRCPHPIRLAQHLLPLHSHIIRTVSMRIYAPRRPLAIMQQQLHEQEEQPEPQSEQVFSGCSPAVAAPLVADPPAACPSSSGSLPFVLLNVFAACLSDPVQPGLLQLLSWQLQRDSLAAVPQLQFLLQSATLHHLFSTDITAFIHTQTAPSSSPLSSPPPALLPLVNRLSSYIRQLEQSCRPASCSGLAARLCLQLRHQLIVRYLSGVEAVSSDFIQELVQLLFPQQEEQRPAVNEWEQEHYETGRRLRRLLLDKGQSTAEYVDKHSYARLLQTWQSFYSRCRTTRAFTDVDLSLQAFCASHFSSSQEVQPQQPQQPIAAAPLPASPAAAALDVVNGLQEASVSPPPAPLSPQPLPLGPRQKQPDFAAPPAPPAAAAVVVPAVASSSSPSSSTAASFSSILIPDVRLSYGELPSMLRASRAGVTETAVREEWQSIVDGTHPDIVDWKRQREADRQRRRERQQARE